MKHRKRYNGCLASRDVRSKKELIAEKPQNIEKMSVAEMCKKYPKDIRRKYPPCLEVLKYWETEFDLDWGEPECFACKSFIKDDAELIAERYKRAGTNEQCNGVFQAWLHKHHQCHLTAACFGGPAQPWNIVYLCPSCHQELDNTFSGYPEDYYQQISWIKMKSKVIMETIMKELKAAPNYEEVCKDLTLENALLLVELMESKGADCIKYIEQNRHSTLYLPSMENRILRMQYALNEFPNKVRQKYGKSLIRHRPVRTQNCL